jgi:uncharacterized iron-regulated protein
LPKFILAALVAMTGAVASAQQIDPADLDRLPIADIVILGEIHDNPDHHLNQAVALRALAPAAVLFEMLTPEQAAIAQARNRVGPALGAAMGWETSGWPPFALYQPVFDAVGSARIYGMAVTRDILRTAFEGDAAAGFAGDASRFGLDRPLDPDEQSEREAMQAEAHCDALPPDMLPGMVAAQRLRDAAFADTVLTALADTGGPVAVITGTGHARLDWGMPAALRRAAPDLRVVSVGQLEDRGDLPTDPPFDLWIVSEPVDRPDPCAGLRARSEGD